MPTVDSPFRGRLRTLSIADILTFLRDLNRKGFLSLSTGGTTIGLYLGGTEIVHATSTREADRLPDANGAMTPSALIEARLRLVKQIMLPVFQWTDGDFIFQEGEEPPKGEIALSLPILDLVMAGIRSVRTESLLLERLPSRDSLFEPVLPVVSSAPETPLGPREESILGMVDGIRPLGEILDMSDSSDLETRRTLFLLLVIGRVKPRSHPSPEMEATPDAGLISEIVERFNGMFGRLYQYLTREIGPISEPLLARSLREARGTYPVLFNRSKLGGDGTLDGAVLQENLQGLSDERQRALVVQGLNEFLYSELLVLRRTLGADHERRILMSFREDRLGARLGLPGRS